MRIAFIATVSFAEWLERILISRSDQGAQLRYRKVGREPAYAVAEKFWQIAKETASATR